METVALTDLERDEMITSVQKAFAEEFQKESSYQSLSKEMKDDVNNILEMLLGIRFTSKANLEEAAIKMLANKIENIEGYVNIALSRASKKVYENVDNKGVLVIYTGGTIGSAPKDINDPDSPEVVKSWNDLKNATPNLGHLGYRIDAISFKEPLDSCNVGPAHWQAMVKIIEAIYNEYEGFVILHGTDTMAYTSSALSFMLLTLKKPVVVTGSQTSGIVNPRNDAHQNMVTAIMLANPTANNIPLIPEVICCFGGKILRGSRTKKAHVVDFQGFTSPNYPELGIAGDQFVIDTKYLKPYEDLDLETWKELDTNVSIIEVFPGMQNSQFIANVLLDESLKGIILKAYGAGNIPTNLEFLSLFEAFIAHGGIVVAVTSVFAGEVELGVYETSQILLDRGIIGGFDITAEAALCKLMVLLGNIDDVEEVKTLMQQSLVGEQTYSLERSLFDQGADLDMEDTVFVFKPVAFYSVQQTEKISDVVLSFKNVLIDPKDEKYVTISIFMDDTEVGRYRKGKIPLEAPKVDDPIGQSANFLIKGHNALFKKIESSARVKSQQKITFKLVVSGKARFKWDRAELGLFINER